MYKVNGRDAAWKKVDEIFPTDYAKDDYRTERAGHPVYVSTAEGHENDYICDLGCRLEVNIAEGNKTTNIWISEEELGHDIIVSVKAESGEVREYETYEAYAKEFRFFWSGGFSRQLNENSAEEHFCKMIKTLRDLGEDGMTLSSNRNGLKTTFKYNRFGEY